MSIMKLRPKAALRKVLVQLEIDGVLAEEITKRFDELCKQPIDYRCKDCNKEDPPMFILHNEIWLSVASRDDILCFECTEKRLGRRITWDDIKPCILKGELLLGAQIYLNSTPGAQNA